MGQQFELRGFRAISNHALAHDSLPSRLKILDWGENWSNDGSKVVLDDASLRVFASNQKGLGRDRVPLDYNHVTVPGTEAYRNFGGCPTIFAYGSPTIVPGDGLYLDSLTWTPTGTLKAKDYEDLSPAPLLENGRVIGLHSCALTPAGAIAELKFYSADTEEALMKQVRGMNYEDLKDPNAYKASQRKAMSDDGKKTTTAGALEEHLKFFRSELGLSDDAGPEDVLDWLKSNWHGVLDGVGAKNALPLKAKGSSVDPSKRNMEMPTNTPHGTITYEAITTAIASAVKGAVEPLQQKIATFEAKAQADTAAAEQGQRDQLVAEASRAGKVIPLSADEIKTVPIGVLKSMVANLPKTLNMKSTADIKPLNADERTATVKGARANAVQKMTDFFARAMTPTIN